MAVVKMASCTTLHHISTSQNAKNTVYSSISQLEAGRNRFCTKTSEFSYQDIQFYTDYFVYVCVCVYKIWN